MSCNGPGLDGVKTCACGLTYDKSGWESLPLCVNLEFPDGRATYPWGEVLEYRNCGCGNTLVIVLATGDHDGFITTEGEGSHR